MTSPQAPLSDGANRPEFAGFRHVSPDLVKVRLIISALVLIPVLLVVLTASVLLDVGPWLAGAALTCWGLSALWLSVIIVRQVPALGYQCREDDLLIERGIMLRRSTLVPYGRLQFVEVEQGPVARRFGLASVELHTAAALSQATIDGLPREEAEALRDLLAARGEADLAGL